jgi:hypothetical protein
MQSVSGTAAAIQRMQPQYAWSLVLLLLPARAAVLYVSIITSDASSVQAESEVMYLCWRAAGCIRIIALLFKLQMQDMSRTVCIPRSLVAIHLPQLAAMQQKSKM